MTPRGTLGLCCVHISQLMTYLAIYTLASWHTTEGNKVKKVHRVLQSQKNHRSNHDGLEKRPNIKFARHRSHNFAEKEQSSRNFPFANQIF